MNKHDYLVDNVNSKSPVDSDHEVRSTQMCSYQQDESTENCSFQQCGASRVRSRNTSQRFLVILEFTHFASFYNFNMNGDDFKNKEQINEIKVRVAI